MSNRHYRDDKKYTLKVFSKYKFFEKTVHNTFFFATQKQALWFIKKGFTDGKPYLLYNSFSGVDVKEYRPELLELPEDDETTI